MVVQVLILLATHVAVPLFFAVWLAFGKTGSRLNWLATLVLSVCYVALMHLAGAWYWLGSFWPYLFWLALAGAVIRFVGWRARDIGFWPPRAFGYWVDFGVTVVVTIFVALGLPSALTARSFEGEAVELRWPLSDGRFHVAHGGGSAVLNHHYVAEAQKYAIDVVQTNAWGIRAHGLVPARLDAYRIWDAPVLAPCASEVVGVENDFDDLDPPETDRDNPAGNHVALYCDGITVVLAHLRRGSVEVALGERVETAQPLGRVGNSGNTSEPHLHMHAVRGRVTGQEDLLWRGEGVAMRFDGRFPVRNDTFVDSRAGA